MRSILLGAAAAIGLFPAIASAVVTVRIDTVNVLPTGADQVVGVDVWADPGEGDTINEGLDAFTIAFNGPRFTASGVRFQVPAPGATWPTPDPAHPYVFTGRNAPPEDFGSTFDRAQVGGTITGQGVNITETLNGLVRLQVLVPGNVTPGELFPIVIDPGAFSLGGTDPSLALAVPGGPGMVNVIPEPASMGLIALGGLLALRRRRVA